MDKIGDQIIVILSGVIGLAIVAVLVSQKAQTGNVIAASGNAFASILGAAVAPVTGNSFGGLSLPSANNILTGH